MEINLKHNLINKLMNEAVLKGEDKFFFLQELRTLSVEQLKKKFPAIVERRCWKGHLMSEENVYFSSGKRRCRECKRRWEWMYSKQGIYHNETI